MSNINGRTVVTPGTGSVSLGKAEDAVHASGDTGVMSLAVRQNTATALGANGDYVPLLTDTNGALWASLATLITGENQSFNRLMVMPNYSYARAIGDALIKNGAGVVHTLTFSATGSITSGVITVYDNTAESGTVIWSGVIQTGLQPVTITLDVAFNVGLYIGFDTTIANVAVTVSYL